MTKERWHNSLMKSLLIYALALLLIFNLSSSKVHASENESILNQSQLKVANKYAERFCSDKADHFFKGLNNEKTLKYTYYRYIGLQSKEIFSKDMYKPLIHQIREKCLIWNGEEEK